ncbi:unnamed protein product [Mytilus coruscus]|uniref:Uncharacterized protein n=1 Tax=Mytilus coruscus TaxID=42192 RepID=A0A6J8C992_MYTCO|nr:unnamed protein product [Mytilus coruscus]
MQNNTIQFYDIVYTDMTVPLTIHFLIKVRELTTDTNVQTSLSTTLHKINSKISTTALVTERKITTDTNVQTSLSSTLHKITSKISTTAFVPVTKPFFPVKMTIITVISVVLKLIVTGLVVIVFLIIRKWNRTKHYFHNTTCDGTNRTAEGEESLQMTSSNHRSNFRSFDVPMVCQQTHHFGIHPVTNYENFADIGNSCQRLDFTLPNEVQQMSTEVHDAHYSASTNKSAKSSTKEGTVVSTKDEEQEHLAYYSTIAEEEVIYDLPQDAF